MNYDPHFLPYTYSGPVLYPVWEGSVIGKTGEPICLALFV